MVEYQVGNGGISRYHKFEHFTTSIVPGRTGPTLDSLLKSYAEVTLFGLMNCTVAPGLVELRQQTPDATWMIASGGDQSELRTVFERRGIGDLFDGGIYGSPEPKNKIVSRLQKEGTLCSPALFLGDSVYDYRVAADAGLDFLFVSGWSEVQDWPEFVKKYALNETAAIGDLVTSSTSIVSKK